jgi:glycosyltransferase involved in cell wall biosynthesis
VLSLSVFGSTNQRHARETTQPIARVAIEREKPMKTPLWGKVDFHLHSYASNVTDYYAANAFSLPESYSDPMKVYRLLKERGMTLVTLTDHNSIDGVRELLDAGKSDVFISAEMTTTFPEDGCNIHVTVANMTEAQFAEIHRLRTNIYEMIAYVDGQIATEGAPGSRGNRLAYFMTHPLMSTQNRPYGREGALAIEHVEKALLLCSTFEVQNGSRTKALNDLTLGMLEALDRPTIERLARKHGLEPKGDEPWLKGIVGGSDDHAGINPGRTWTEFPHAGRPTANDVIDAIRRRETRPGGGHGGPITLAHSVLKLLYEGSTQNKASGAKVLSIGGPVHALLSLAFDSGDDSRIRKLVLRAKVFAAGALARLGGRSGDEPFEKLFQSEVHGLLADPDFRAALAHLDATDQTDDRIFFVIGTLLNRIFARYVANLRDGGRLNLIGFVKQLAALATSNVLVALPYLMSFLQQSSDCLIVRDVRKTFGLAERQRVVLVTDTFFDVNGVAATIRRMIREAVRRDLDFTVVTCLGTHEREQHLRDPEIRGFIASGRLKLFTPVAQMDFPEYDRLQIRIPPFLDLLRYLQESGFTKIQISTPGIIGLSALLAAKTLQIETAATYHTSVPEYVENYTRDISLEALAWKYMIAFYHSVDEVLVPSKFIARLLHKRGLRNRKLLIFDRWVDVDRFHPRNRTEGFWKRFGIENEDAIVKFIYVGRVGVEKNLQQVADAYLALRKTRTDCHLVIVGDGPYRAELEKRLAGAPATFTGFLEGDDLCRAIASADAKLYPSTTDTWGNAPLEAQSSGIPVVVSAVGGPAELMVEGVTGLKVSGHDTGELTHAMLALMSPELRSRLGRQARVYAEAHRVAEPFTAIFDAEAYRRRLREENAPDDLALRASEAAHLASVYFANDADALESKYVA